MFHLGTTEGLFVRIDSEVARLARATAEERQVPLRELVEYALRSAIAEITEPAQRAAALHAMEEALLGRMDRRLGQHFERVSGLYARQAFDTAQTLDLVKRLLAIEVRGDREQLSKYITESRAEATRILKQRVDTESATLPEVAQELQKARERAAQWEAQARKVEEASSALESAKYKLEAENRDLKAQGERLTRDLDAQKRKAAKTQDRFTWAVKQFESQRGFSKRSLTEILAEYDKEEHA